MDQLAALRALRRVVELGSFTAAADALGISHTIVSRQVRQLEEHLGTQLLNRTTRRFALTGAGRDYYEAARQVLDTLDEADRHAGRHQAEPTGILRINAPMAFGTIEVAQWLPDFMAKFPGLQVDLVCNDRMVDLIEDGFDVALRLARALPDSTLVARRIATSKVLLVASAGYLRRHGAPAMPEDLARHNCLLYSAAARANEWTLVGTDGAEHAVAVRGSLQANTNVALRAAAVAGVGIANAAAFIVREELERGTLVEVLPGYTPKPRELYALYPQNRHLAPKVRAFIDYAAGVYINNF
jgi:DNA-binding transcriptional LysR family regulator